MLVGYSKFSRKNREEPGNKDLNFFLGLRFFYGIYFAARLWSRKSELVLGHYLVAKNKMTQKAFEQVET